MNGPTTKYTPDVVRKLNGGVQAKYKFPNGYSASVVQHQYSYGHEEGLWELGVLGKDGHLTYDTPVTDDVIGYLDDSAVEETLAQIEALPDAGDR